MTSINQRLLQDGTIQDDDAAALLVAARNLKKAAGSGGLLPTLRGKNLALAMEPANAASERVFELAAEGLGARVSHISAEGLQKAAGGSSTMAQALGRLYDAVDCGDLPADVALALQRQLAIPVYRGLGRRDHPVSALLERMQPDPRNEIGEDDRVWMVQALLACTVPR